MFTVELRVNGALIAHIYGRNAVSMPDNRAKYEYEYYEPGDKRTMDGAVYHRREEGLPALASLILADVAQKEAG